MCFPIPLAFVLSIWEPMTPIGEIARFPGLGPNQATKRELTFQLLEYFEGGDPYRDLKTAMTHHS